MGPGEFRAGYVVFSSVFGLKVQEFVGIDRAWLVIVVSVADTIDEAVELANASDYSLVASLWTRDINLAFEVAPRIRAGQYD